MALPVMFRVCAATIARPIGGDRSTSTVAPIERKPADCAELNDDAGNAARDDGEARGMMKAIALDVSGRAGVLRSGLKAMFSARIAAAYRSGMSAAQIAVIVRGIKQEMQAALRAAAEAASAELTGRMAGASTMTRGTGRRPTRCGKKATQAIRQKAVAK
jgi:hypothetical protein